MTTKRRPYAQVEKPDLKAAKPKQEQTNTGRPLRCIHDWLYVGAVGDAYCHRCKNWMNID